MQAVCQVCYSQCLIDLLIQFCAQRNVYTQEPLASTGEGLK